MSPAPTGWLLLVHQIPPKPAYFRAKVLRRLTQLGAIPLKKSAYLLPAGDTALEDFHWLRREIVEQGGDAWILQGSLIAGLTDDQARESFRRARAADFAELTGEARALLDRARVADADHEAVTADWRRLDRRVKAAVRLDFFDAPGREELEVLMDTIDRTLHPAPASAASAATALRGRTWMTRAGVKVDRIASAWLIRRFIDPAATFVFTEPGNEPGTRNVEHPADVVRFDMYEGEFTHDGDLCTFEVLLRASAHAGDSALQALGQIVHDLDLKDERYQRPETLGVAAMIQGITARHADDNRRLVEGATLLDALYASLQEGSSHGD
jgi:hypothetical protein